MTTDTIPEAREATSEIFRRDNSVETDVFSQEHFDSLNDVVEKACLAYHKRKLEECGGDAGELLEKIRAPLCIDVGKTLELLQLHTAKAVEEALEKQQHICTKCGYVAVSQNISDTIADLRTRAEAERDRANDIQCKFNAVCSTVENERTRAEKAEAEALSLRLAVADGTTALHDKLQKAEAEAADATTRLWSKGQELAKAEAEVAEARRETKIHQNEAVGERNAHSRTKEQLTQLQKDVRPLLSKTQQAANQIKRSPTWDSHISGSWQILADALETFLAKHPELKP